MYKAYLLFFLFFHLSFNGFSQTYYGDLFITSQAQLDTLSEYQGIDGQLVIGDFYGFNPTDISDLNPLYRLKSVLGRLVISANPKLKNLDGLDSLQRIKYSLVISFNDSLTDLSAINQLVPDSTQTPLYVNIYNNTQLVSLTNFLDSFDMLHTLRLSKNSNLVDLGSLPSKLKTIYNLDFHQQPNLQTINFQANYINSIEIDQCDALTSIEMPNLDTFTVVHIHENPNLQSISGFTGFGNVDGTSVKINDNSQLQSINGFNQVQNFYTLEIINNDNLLSINNLFDNTTQMDRLTISQNPRLKSFGPFDNPFPKIAHNIEITLNDSLASVQGLLGLERVESSFGNEGELNIYKNPLLETLIGLDSLTFVDQYLNLRDNHILNLQNLSSLDSVGYNLIFYDKNPFSSLHGLESLIYIGNGTGIEGDSINDISALANNLQFIKSIYFGYNSLKKIDGFNQLNINSKKLKFNISNNHLLKYINGFSSIDSFYYQCFIHDNNSLETIHAFSNTVSCNSLSIHTNPNLTDISGLCHLFTEGTIAGTIDIHDNAAGFNSQQEIIEWCMTPTIDLPTWDAIAVYPNPTADAFFVDVPMDLIQVGMMVDLVDISGISHFSARIKDAVSSIPVGDLAPGLYFLRIVFDERLVQVKKVLVER